MINYKNKTNNYKIVVEKSSSSQFRAICIPIMVLTEITNSSNALTPKESMKNKPIN